MIVNAAGLDWLVPFHRGWLGHPRRAEPYTQAEHLRMALEDLGTTFIKLGQSLSTRADLLSPEYQHELAKLQDSAPGVPLEEVETAFVKEFGAPPSALYAWFDGSPLAAASIGQAHAAPLPGGHDAVVKIRGPGVVDRVPTDLEILPDLARRADRNWRHASEYDLIGRVDEFSDTLRAELDYNGLTFLSGRLGRRDRNPSGAHLGNLRQGQSQDPVFGRRGRFVGADWHRQRETDGHLAAADLPLEPGDILALLFIQARALVTTKRKHVLINCEMEI